MKQGTIKTIKETSILLEMGIDFQANDLENTFNGLRSINQKKLNEIVRKNFKFAHASWCGYFDKQTQTIMATVQEPLYI